jgi:hypothetical protein
MLLKQKDTMNDQVMALDRVLKSKLSAAERQRIEKQRSLMVSGIQGEEEAAYHIDFHLRDSPNWVVIHDLRLEWNGRVAQIDHLIIDRFLEVYVVESKNFKTKVRYANGGWERLKQNHWEGFPCPIEQNRRHVGVLRDLIDSKMLSPARLGILMPPKYISVILVNPSCSIVGQFPSDVRIYRMDTLVTKIRNEDFSPLSMLKIVSSETLRDFGNKLASYHQPAPSIAEKHSGEQGQDTKNDNAYQPNSGQTCAGCGGPITQAEAFFCRVNKARFGGAALCRKCQTMVPIDKPMPTRAPQPTKACCEDCGVALETRVMEYCRDNSKRFEGKLLCRKCQSASSSGAR